MRKNLLLTTSILVLLFASLFLTRSVNSSEMNLQKEQITWWPIQSIDTMKFSRDLAREKLQSPEFFQTIDQQVSFIATTGATHVAVATPYDEEFIPFLTKWVESARKNGLKVWFRGNFSGWEGWFDYPRIRREEHILKIKNFILTHPELFQDGDIFDACPECENGGPGDPRHINDLEGHRAFLIKEYRVTKSAFQAIGKNVLSNFHSMNGDVAMLLMDEETTRELGGLVAVDHYQQSPEKLAGDLQELAQKSRGNVVLSEFGAPIPNIHDRMTQREQAAWLEESMNLISKNKNLLGVNYWVGFGGTTSLWDSNSNPKEAAFIIAKFFKPRFVKGVVKNQLGKPIMGAKVSVGPREVETYEDGSFSTPFLSKQELKVTAGGYQDLVYSNYDESQPLETTLIKNEESLLFRIVKILHDFFESVRRAF